MKRLPKYIILVALSLGFIIRLIVILNNGAGPSYTSPASTDEVNYRELARNIVENKIYGAWSECFFTRSMRAPSYPALLASANFAIHSEWTALGLNLVLDTMNIFLVYILAVLVFGNWTSLVSASLYSIFAPSFIYLHLASTEIFAVFLLLNFLISLLRYEKFLSWNCSAMIIFYSILIHTRPSFLPLIVILPVIIFMKKSRESKSVKENITRALAPVIIIMILCLPWTWRNYNIQKTIIPVIVVPVWHTLESTETNLELSADAAMDFIYAPEHEGWSEGIYFNQARHKVLSIFQQHHFKILVFGAIRILKAWCFPDFYKRFFLPQAYFNPVPLWKDFFIPLPDFEGIVYLFFLTLIVTIFFKRERIKGKIKEFLLDKLWLIIFIGAYLAVHLVAVPFPQYRFIIEPLIIIFLSGIITEIFLPNEKIAPPPLQFITPMAILLSLAMILPLSVPRENTPIHYPKSPSNFQSYRDLRKKQWENLGQLPNQTLFFAQGRIRYIRHGFKFIGEGSSPAEKNENWTVAKLYVNENSEQYPLGIGDLKLNIRGNIILNDGDYMSCIGIAKTGIFRELIMDVENWEIISEKK